MKLLQLQAYIQSQLSNPDLKIQLCLQALLKQGIEYDYQLYQLLGQEKYNLASLIELLKGRETKQFEYFKELYAIMEVLKQRKSKQNLIQEKIVNGFELLQIKQRECNENRVNSFGFILKEGELRFMIRNDLYNYFKELNIFNVNRLIGIEGISGSGKTQILLQLAITHLLSSNQKVVIIDLKGDINYKKLHYLLLQKSTCSNDITCLLTRIQLIRFFNYETLMNFLAKYEFYNTLLLLDNIDQLLLYAANLELMKNSMHLIAWELISSLRRIAKQYQITVIITTHVVKNMESKFNPLGPFLKHNFCLLFETELEKNEDKIKIINIKNRYMHTGNQYQLKLN
ncbi:hypothetical protein K502DRAFT_332698 [Neoconidiobolus thromboides FSU 785]|nr:hypothetical protein K502DRAFT_332698 [Neoconidiobolus thromboides FSU 785]